ncbi:MULTISPECIES: YifB family Mg chelatase-like AAA ATPase [unclassified Sulfurospirillum]|uniref:YifB family Mg chelatase-like AAA ATPase n=1 Tax=unclassified Sulfurospirillum TaxID=2618290 RepID=UPI00050565F7|nr:MULTISPECIES: YifB family Mg chelatase-like AAA ATPase [unclassified Sulfurospirillum]KFL34533.1 Fis family transcriptional regulator [Sulfurospirillum sp. SCADC]
MEEAVALSKVKHAKCATLFGNKAYEVDVESTLVRALPGFNIVGLTDVSIQESRERVKSALSSIDFQFPSQKITINLSPSDLKKEGSHFDLVTALLIAIQKERFTCKDFFIFGELGLDGKIKKTNSMFPIILSLASHTPNLRVLVPSELLAKVHQIPNIEAFGVETLHDALLFFKEKRFNNEAAPREQNFCENVLDIENKRYFYSTQFPLDFSDVLGQHRAKRAMTIAAAGMHNLLMEGSPGCGKSMSIKRLRYILPPQSIEEILESNAYQSLQEEDVALSPLRPFRSPHHTSSRPSIFGGGSSQSRAGEIALAHNGILFFDEFPNFSKTVLESLREPLEDHRVLISRVNTKVSYATKFLFAAAQNPCPCGNLFSQTHECRCSEVEINRYKNRISEPIMDRIDLYIQMSEESSKEHGLSSAQMFDQVLKAFIMQKSRGQQELNGKLDEHSTMRFCTLEAKAAESLEMAQNRLGLSQRSIHKVLRIARSIADLAQSELILQEHLLEALSFRKR